MRIINKFIPSLVLLLTSQLLQAQHKVTIVVEFPSYHRQGDTVHIAGSFNNWNPAGKPYFIQNREGRTTVTLDLPKGSYEFKFTRGSWYRAETGENGAPMENRRLVVEDDMTMETRIRDWADHFPQKERQHTASRNVQVIDTAFFIPQLNRYRRVWIYLPADYSVSKSKYPVLYMHDGQNIFDEYTSAYGEWGVDEALDSLKAGAPQAIVVGIDHGGDKRMNEYAPYDMERFGKGEGEAYVNFLVKNLKPFIDRHYRTKKDRSHTFIAGSSMGGLISFYAMVKYPKVFGGAGVFSPAFWVNPQIRELDRKKLKKVKGRIYFLAGLQEGDGMVSDMLMVFDRMRHFSKARMITVVRSGGRHNEATWRKEFPLFYNWLLLRKGDRSQN